MLNPRKEGWTRPSWCENWEADDKKQRDKRARGTGRPRRRRESAWRRGLEEEPHPQSTRAEV